MPRRAIIREDYAWFFEQADSNHDGYISFKELKAMLRGFGYKGSNADIRYMFTVTDSDSDGRLSYEEFMEAMGQFPERLYLNAMLLRIFRKFDQNNDGVVTHAEFLSAADELGRHMTPEQVNEIIEAADMDKSRTLNYEEFAKEVNAMWGRCDILDMFFNEADQDNDNHLDIQEVIAMMRRLGYTGSNVRIKEQFKRIDTSGDDRVSYDEFMAAMGVIPQNGYFDRSYLMRRIFKQFDKDRNGRIDEKELKRALAEIGKHFNEKQVKQIMAQADKDKSGGLDYEEFIEHVQELFKSLDAFERFFREADVNDDGDLSLDELVAVLRQNGYGGGHSQIKRMFAEADTSKDGKISFSEYMDCMGRQPKEVHTAAVMRKIFQDLDKNGDGTLDQDELRTAFREMGTKIPRRKVKHVLKQADRDGSGSLNYEEFITVVIPQLMSKSI